MKYKIFINDAGPHRYTCFADINAYSETHAKSMAEAKTQGLRNFGKRPVRMLIIPASTVKEWARGSQAEFDKRLEDESRKQFQD